MFTLYTNLELKVNQPGSQIWRMGWEWGVLTCNPKVFVTSLFVQNGILTSIYVSDVCSYNLDKICPNSRKVTKVYFYVIVDAVRANIYI